MKTINGIPVYNICLTEETDGIDLVSFVDTPAIETKGFAFEHLKDNFKFEVAKDKQMVAGPALIPDLPIIRRVEDGSFYYVIFTKEVIVELVSRFKKTEKRHRINVDHQDIVESAYIFADWIIEDPEKDKSRMYGFDLPVGTWFIETKVDDTEFWNREIKEGQKYGYSIEGFFDVEMAFMTDIINKNKTKENTMTKLKFVKETLVDGTVIYVSAIEVGGEVKVVDENGDSVPVFDGEHVLVDGKTLVTVDGKITEVKPASETETEMAEEAVVVEEETPEEVIETPATEITEEAIMHMLQPKFDEIYAMIAKLQNDLETASVAVAPVEMSATVSSAEELINKTQKLKALFGK